MYSKKCQKKNVEDLRMFLFAMQKAYIIQEFDELMGKIETIDKKLTGYLSRIGYHKWSLVHK